MTTGAESLRAGMLLSEVAEAVGAAAVFQVDRVFYKGGTSNMDGQQIPAHGVLRGQTLTSPPLEWSIGACRRLNGYTIGQRLTPDNLLFDEGMSISTFRLEAPTATGQTKAPQA